MNKEELIKRISSEAWGEAPDSKLYESTATAIINEALEGFAIVPVEPSTKMVQWSKYEALNNIEPRHAGTLSHFVEFYKAMLSASQQEEG